MSPTINAFGISFSTYTLFTLGGFISAIVFTLLLRPKEFPAKYVFGGVMIIAVFGFIGAIILSMLTNAIRHPGWDAGHVMITSGLAYLGFPIFGLTALWVYCRIIKLPFLAAADYAAPFLMLERVFGRMGCLMNGCCQGTPSNLPWAFPFWHATPSHPTQAYELAIVVAVLISSAYLYKKTEYICRIKPSRDPATMNIEELKQLIRESPSAGIVLCYVIGMYSFLRFFNEFLRIEGPFLYGSVKASHLLLAILTALSVAGFIGIVKRSARGDDILKALKGAVTRFWAWLAVSLVVILSFITIYNVTYLPTTKYKPVTSANIPEVKIPLGRPIP